MFVLGLEYAAQLSITVERLAVRPAWGNISAKAGNGCQLLNGFVSGWKYEELRLFYSTWLVLDLRALM